MNQKRWKQFLAENSAMGLGNIEGASGDSGLVLEDDAWTENDGEEPKNLDIDGTVDGPFSDFRSEVEEDQEELDEVSGVYSDDEFDVPDDIDDDDFDLRDESLDDPDGSLNGLEDEDFEDDLDFDEDGVF